MIGRVVGNFRIVRELGSGAMGSVYEGIDIMVERPVAVKMLRAEIARQPDLIERFRVEAVTLAKLNHPAIATLYSFFREGEDYYMVMEFVRGRTLEDVIKESGKLPARSAADIMCQTLDGMAHAHQLGILHRDIKPANIMITGDGKVKVTDFGIARVLGSSRMTREGRIIGTLEYIAPERIRGEETDARSDLYSAGIVLFEMLSGRLPFTSGTDYGLMQAHLSEPPPPMVALGVNCPTGLEDVLMRSLAKNPAERYQTAIQFRDAIVGALPRRGNRTATMEVPASAAMKPTRLAEAGGPPPTRLAPAPAAGSTVTAQTAGAGGAAQGPAPKTPWAVIGAGLATLLLAGGTAIWYFRPKPAPQTVPTNQTQAQIRLDPVTQPPAMPIQGSPLEQPQVPGQIPQPVGQIPVQSIAAPAPTKPAPIPAKPPATDRPAPQAPPANPPPATNPAPVETARTVSPPASPLPAVTQRRTVRNIHDVEKLYIDRLPAELRGYIADEIQRQLNGRIAVVSRRDDADAIMTGREESSDDLGSKVTGGYLGMKDQANAQVTITDASRGMVLWSSQAGDKTPILGVVKRGGLKKVAERLVGNLRRAIE